ncbi:DUF2306 domain-containing protein [Flavobacterium sp.]|uniref:DUF2306 domain-containing protein n=1 Tax=Flavobacterium sp. TaxID=239 RepID=UPI0038D46A65
MLKKISIAFFWLAFFGFFLYKLIPKYAYLTNDTLKHWGSNTTFDNSIFALHIFAGIVVYCTAILQFTPSIRNKYISFHRITGKLYILSSLLCITTLYIIIPRTWCIDCRPSQFIVTSLWLLFIIIAFYFIKKLKIKLHKRMMISSFICAAYFVTVRVIDGYCMDVFYYLFPNKSTAYLASDVFVWLIPLLFFNLYWLIKDKKQRV